MTVNLCKKSLISLRSSEKFNSKLLFQNKENTDFSTEIGTKTIECYLPCPSYEFMAASLEFRMGFSVCLTRSRVGVKTFIQKTSIGDPA